mmetsp:Transcript_21688/g.26126  ORF Transcript_21688/g.26126 Transcript_21688/m.26126 type:complete len:364 (-) Transcript_21688:182-1273(-)
MGRLGLCCGLCLEAAGYNVLGVDIFPDYVDAINNKTLKSLEPSVMSMLQQSKNLSASLSLDEALDFSDLILILVDTPSTGGDRHYDVSKLGRVLNQINKKRVENKHVVVCCTVMPTYIKNIGEYLLRDCVNTTLSYNPEFIAQGDIIRGLLYPDMVLIGEGSKAAGDVLEEVYRHMCHNNPTISRMSPSSAEITKISVNCFVSMKIAFANQIADLAEVTPGADKCQVLKAVGADTRVGSKCLKPGYGFGGPCLPRDNRALAGFADSVGVDLVLSKATDMSNQQHADLQARELLRNDLDVYEFESVAYKEGSMVPIIEESQKLAVAAKVAKGGKKVVIRDTELILDAVRAQFGSLFTYEEIPTR